MEEKPYQKWLALAALSIGVFMGLLDVTVVNVALPTMQKSFNEPFNNLQWVLSSYTIVFAVMILILSKLGDMYGRKKIFLASIILFIIASAANGLAPTLLALDISRAVQAIGGAGMMSLSMALVASNFDGAKRGIALGIVGSVIGLSSASGPLVGGLLVEKFGWQSIFYINVPVGIIAVIMTFLFVKETPSYGKDQRVDILGMLLSAATLFCAIFGLIQKEDNVHMAWTNPRIGGWLFTAIILLVIFIVVEMKLKYPMMNLRMFKQRNFVGAVIVAFALGAGVYSMNTFITILMQNYIGWSAFDTGIRQLAISVWSLILGPITGILGQKYSRKGLVSGGLVLVGIGFVLLINGLSLTTGYPQILPMMILMGIGNAIVNPLLNTVGLDGVPLPEMGMASGLLNVFRQFGVSFGIVILGLVQANAYENQLAAKLPNTNVPKEVLSHLQTALIDAGPFGGHAIAFSQRIAQLPGAKQFQVAVVESYNRGLATTLMTGTIIVLLGALGALTLLKRNERN